MPYVRFKNGLAAPVGGGRASNLRYPAEPMQRLLLFLLLGLALAACDDNGTNPDDSGNPGSNTVTMTQLTGLPMTGGDVTGVAITSGNTIIAAVDGKLYSMSAAGGSMQLINGDAKHSAIALAPSGELYALTETEFRSYDLPAGTYRSAPIDPAGPFAMGRRIEESEIMFSPSGEPYIKLINNTPQTYVYRSSDKGTSWQAVPMPSGFQYGGGLAFAPNGDMLMSSAFGLYRSSNGGTSWTSSPAPRPNYGGNMMVTANGDIYHYPRGGGGLVVSHDGGASFTELTPFNKAPYFTSLQQGPDGNLYALARRGSGNSDDMLYPTSFLRSGDRGATWQHVLFAQGRAFSMKGSMFVIGLGVSGLSSTREHGGLVISRDGGEIWTPAGTRPVEQIVDIDFDKDGNLMILADQGLYRKTSSGWQTLGTQPNVFFRFAATPQGTLLLANTTATFYSADNGDTWSEALIPDYQMSSTGSPGMPALIGRKNGEFLFSITSYADAYGHTNGHLYRVGNDGKPVRIPAISQSFSSLAEDHNGKLYASTQTVDPLRQVFVGEGYTSNTGGTSWDKAPSVQGSSSFNSQNRYFLLAGNSGFALKTLGNDNLSELKLEGFTSQPHYITRSMFGSDDRLYLVTLDNGVFISNAPVR